MSVAAGRVVLPVLAVIVITYVPFLGGGLLTDDFVHLARLEDMRSTGELVTAPDAFGFYRPLTQASLALDRVVLRGNATAGRAENLALHAGVLAMAFVVARLVLPSPPAAAAAVLAFALTPKAHPIAVLWLSARGELLMALFSLACVAAWIGWSRGRGAVWLAAAAACYVLALLSKEAALLLPALLLLTPASTATLAARFRGALLLAALGMIVLWWRSGTGALMPFSTDAHYNLDVPLFRLARNARNYLERMLPAPLVVAAVAVIAARRPSAARPVRGAVVFSIGWMIVYLAPVLGIVARNELYLYLPTFGCCLLAAALTARWLDRLVFTRVTAAVVVAAVAGLAAYQVSRSAAFHADLVFSARLVAAMAGAPVLRGHRGPLVLVAEEAETRQFLADAIGGYTPLVARRALGRDAFSAGAPTLRLRCGYAGRRVALEPLP